jgi:putative ABC transport system permease protein
MLSFSYALRNLFRDKPRLLQTVGGSALVVLLVMAAMALNGGMMQLLSASGSEVNVILLGAGSEESTQRSEVSEMVAEIAEASVPGIVKVLGTAAVSSEIHHMTFGESGRVRGQLLLRGVTPRALLVYPQVRLLEGDFPQAGEVMVGRLAWLGLGAEGGPLRPGGRVKMEGVEWVVSGVFAAPGTVMESEMWLNLGDLRVLAQRDSVSCVVLRMENPDDFGEADLFSKQRLDLELTALRERDYYDALSGFFRPLRVMVWITAGLVATGAVFGGLNTLYAAFASRIRELATLQAVGFGRGAILMSLVQESLLACMAGALVAAVVALVWLDGVTIPFSIGAFTASITPTVVAVGLATGVLLGILGGLPPALRCLLPPLPIALRA